MTITEITATREALTALTERLQPLIVLIETDAAFAETEGMPYIAISFRDRSQRMTAALDDLDALLDAEQMATGGVQ